MNIEAKWLPAGLAKWLALAGVHHRALRQSDVSVFVSAEDAAPAVKIALALAQDDVTGGGGEAVHNAAIARLRECTVIARGLFTVRQRARRSVRPLLGKRAVTIQPGPIPPELNHSTLIHHAP